MEPITWTVTEANGQVTRQGKKLAYKQPFEITDKTPKAQIPVIDGWNEMQKCLIENGLMESS
jgi:hypothetical protein